MTLKDIQKHCTNNKAEGILCVAEDNTDVVPFEIKRVYYTYETDKEIIRGHHAHKKLEQLLICVYGEIEIQLDNGNGETETVILNDPSKGLYVGPMMWHTMKWLKNDSILLVLASEHYDENDYIRNYDSFLSLRERERERERERTKVNNNHFTINYDTKISFAIHRVYYIYGVKQGIVRGHHAHKKLKQVLICLRGAIEIMLDEGHETKQRQLDSASAGLYVGPSTWRTMKWLQDDSVLLVLASEHYDENDYIRNYDDFIKWIHQGENNADTI